MKKKIIIAVIIIAAIFGGKYYYDMNLNHNFETITEGKVYKSGVIPPEELPEYIKKHNIKSVVDLRFPGTADEINNPEIPEELTAEKEVMAEEEEYEELSMVSDLSDYSKDRLLELVPSVQVHHLQCDETDEKIHHPGQ